MKTKPLPPLFKTYSFSSPTHIVFGTSSLDRLKDELKIFSSKRTMLIAGDSVSKMPAYRSVMEMIPAPVILEYKGIPPEPDAAVLARLYEEISKEPPDLIIGLGGGSTMDMAKLASLMVGNQRSPLPYFKGEPIAKRGPPIVTIPTIAGTGSEVTPISVVSEKGIKLVLNHPYLSPALSIIDPTLSLSAPLCATASAGIDALNHAVESIMSMESNPLTASLALEAINLADEHLERLFADGENLEARNGIALASVMAGIAFSNTGVCITHGIAYTYALKCGLPHGISVAIAEPYVIEFNAPAIPSKIGVIAAGLSIVTEGLSAREVGEAVAMRYLEIMDTLGIPMSLKDLCLREEDVEPLADAFLNNYSRLIARNPRHPSRQELVELYRTMLEGY